MTMSRILSMIIMLVWLLSPLGAATKHTICYLGVINGDAVTGGQCQRVNGMVARMLSHLERVKYVDVSALGTDPGNKEALNTALTSKGVTYTVALRLDSVVTREKRYTRKNRDGGQEEYSRYEGRTNFDVVFTSVKSGRTTTKHAYTLVTMQEDTEKAALGAMDGVDEAVKTFMLNFFAIQGKLKLIDHEKTALIDVGSQDGVEKGDDFGVYNSKGDELGKLDCKEVLGRHAAQGTINRNKKVKAILAALDNGEELTIKTLRKSEPIFSQSMLRSGSLEKAYDDAKSLIKGIGSLFK